MGKNSFCQFQILFSLNKIFLSLRLLNLQIQEVDFQQFSCVKTGTRDSHGRIKRFQGRLAGQVNALGFADAFETAEDFEAELV